MQPLHHLRRHHARPDGGSHTAWWLAFALGACLSLPLGAQPRFVRGEIDGTGGVSLGDAIILVEHLVRGAPSPACADAADVNDDGKLDVTDVSSVLLHLYRGGAPPLPPHPDCGSDATPDALVCEEAPDCRRPAEQEAGALPEVRGAMREGLAEDVRAASPAPLETDAPELASRLESRESRALPPRALAAGRGGSIIAAGQVVSGEILTRTQVDEYELDLAPGSSIVLDRIASSNAAALAWRLEDRWGRVVVENATALNDLGPVAVLGGAYTLTVFPEGNGLGSYTFRWIDATPVDRRVAIDEVIPPGTIDADHPGQRHRFDFSAAPNQTIFLDSLATGTSALNWELADGHGRILFSSRRIADQGPIALVGGEYRLTVEGALASGNLATGSYELRIAGVPATTPQPVVLGATAAGAIAVPGEIDAWTFTAAPGQRIFLDQLTSTNSGALDWELTDHAGRAVLARTTSLSDVGPITLAGGDYTLRILPEGGNVGSYSFRLADVTTSVETIAIGVEVPGTIPADRPGSTSAYDFTSAPARLVTVELITTTNVGGLDWVLEDAQGRRVLAQTTSLNTVGPIALVGGGYRLNVLGEGAATGTYRFRLRDDGAAGAAATGAARVIGDVVDEAIAVPGGEMRYTFAAAAGQSVYLDLLLGHNDLDWSIVDAVGTTLGSARANSVDVSDLGPFPLAAGSYTVVVKARTATAAPPYRFHIAATMRQTSDVALGDTIEGDFTGAPGSSRVYRFDAAGGELVFLDRLIASTRLSWSLLDPVGQPVFALVRADGVDNDMGPFPLAAGTYSLLLDPDAGYQPAYRIGIRSVLAAEDTAAPGDIVSGSFAGQAGSTRTVRVDVAEGQRLLIDRRAATARLDASLIDPAGQPVFGPLRIDNGDGDQGPFTLGGGTYRLVLDPQDGYEPSYDFQIVDVDDASAPLVLGQPQQGSLGPGGTASYGFHADAGARFYVDLATGASSLSWSLLDELGEAVFRDRAAATAAADVGPLNLAAGDYRLVLDATASNAPAFAFTAWMLAVDLGVESFSGTPLVLFAGDATREVEVTWNVLNRGGGPAPTGAWTDRLTYSADTVPGNADDIVLGDFVRFDTLAPGDSYERRELVRIPATAPLGQHRIFLSVDVAGAHAEPGGEADNIASVEVAVVADLPAAEPDFISTTTFPFTLTGATPGATVDVALSRAVSLDSIRYVHAEALNMELRATTGTDIETSVTMSLLSGQQEVLEVSSVNADAGQSPTNFVVRFSRRLTPQVVALLPRRSVDGVRFRFDQPATTQTTVKPIYADTRLRVHFAGCEFAPCGPHLERRSPGLEGATQQGNGASPWRAVTFDEAVPGAGLRFVSGPNFTGGASNFLGVVSALTEAQLILDDGTLLTLDDVRAPSTLGLPPFQSLAASHSLGLASSQLAGRQILGFQWRIRVNGAGLGTPSAGFSPVNDAAIRFLYEVETCHGSIDIPPVEVSPADGSAFAPGSMVTIGGRALAPQAGRPVSAVLVNGEPVDSLDASGRFFKSVRIAAGENIFVVQVVEPGCGESESSLRLLGLTDGSSGLDGYVEATSELQVEYADTTFQRVGEALVVRARARNVSAHAVRGPILLALTGLTPASAALRGAAGLTAQGEPFTVLLESGALEPGMAGPYAYLVFANPDRQRVHYGVRWLIPVDRPPHFESSPAVSAVAGQAYRYAAAASDPDGDAVALELERGPAGMILDPAGTLSWTPAMADLGTHDVVLAAVAAGARATQRWTLVVSDSAPRRPPYFSTAPVTGAAVGGSYLYDADAVDPDGDALAYSLLEAPAGMVVGSSDGRVAWAIAAAGEHRVSLRAGDGAGGEAVQTFTVAVGSTPSNPSAPRITTAPATAGRIGVLYIYQPVASDPDGDLLEYTLPEAPEGMTIDARGRIAWTPTAEQIGVHTVSLLVGDGRGGESSQRFEISVEDGAANLPPVIESVPAGFTLAGAPYRYQVAALDPDGDPLRFALASAPAGMIIGQTSGLVEWTPAAGAAGKHLVAIEAADDQGAAGRQVYELVVRTANAAPQLASPPPPAQITAGRVYQIDVDAGDADGDLLRYELAQGPAAITVHPITGLTTWSTTPSDVGEHQVIVRAVDAFGARADASFTVTVVPDVQAPQVLIGFSAAPAAVGAEVSVTVGASDDVGIASRTLTVECPPDAPRELTLDVLGRATFASPRTGYCIFRATATDPSGNVTPAEAVLQVGNPEDPLDPHPPVVSILTPAPGSVITDLTSIAATISDATEDGRPGSAVVSWTVEIGPALTELSAPGQGAGGAAASTGLTEIGRGTGEVTTGLLATFDPTLLPNGVYRLRIVASDGVQTGGVEYQVSISGELKLGQFTFDATDLVVPLASLPIVVSRRYDSLDTSRGDFGAGWRLALPGEVEDAALEMRTGNGLVDLLGTEPMKSGGRVYVTRPDGQRVGFTFTPQGRGGFLAMLHVARFEADQGVTDRLEVVEPAGDFFVFGGVANQVGVPYNPTVYRLTTQEGVSYTIDELAGLQRMEDRGGNAIDVTPQGLFSALGPSVSFERDALGRIQRLLRTDPVEGTTELSYAYDTAGNLAGMTDAVGAETRYFYEEPLFPHYLTRIADPLGRPWLRNAYDDEGRLVGICGAGGNLSTLEGCTAIEWEPGTRASTMTDSRGFRIDRVYDERGRTLLERRYLDDSRFLESRNEYDAAGNLVREIDASGEEWTYSYDVEGQLIASTDPLGRTSLTTWDDCGEPTSETAPDGSTVRFSYDESCNRLAIEDATGGTFSFAYDQYTDQTEATDPVGNRWQFEYGGNGHLSNVIDPRGGSFPVRTSADGDVLSRSDPDGRQITYAYDGEHRLLRETWNSVPPRELTYEYDPAGQLVLATDGQSTIHMEYLPTGRLSRVTTEASGGAPEVSMTYEHDANGNVTRVSDSFGGTTTYEHDGAGRLVSIRQSGASVEEKRVDFVWSQGSNVVEIRRFADLAGSRPVATTTYTYECESCEDGPASIVHRRAAESSIIHALELERSLAGLVTAMVDAEGRHEYAYDASMRLLRAVHPGGGVQPDEQYTYDAAGNRTASHRGSYVYGYAATGAGNEIQSDGQHRYETDAAGNITRRIDLSTGASTEFRYDHRYRLTEVIQRGPGGAETGRSSYAYDVFDRRIRSAENGSVTHVVHDGQNPILVLDGSGDVQTRRLYGRALDGVLADETGGVTRWLLTDHLGTVRDVVGDDGRPVAHFVYDSFGVLLSGSLADASGGLGFTARELSSSTGLYALRARDYDPELGRFLRRDPLTPFQYEYALGSPLSFVDLSGLAGRRPRPIDRPPWLRPKPTPRLPPRDYGPDYIPGYTKKWGPQGPGTYRRREPRSRGGGPLAELAILVENIAIPALLAGGFATAAGAVGAAVSGIAAALYFSQSFNP